MRVCMFRMHLAGCSFLPDSLFVRCTSYGSTITRSTDKYETEVFKILI